MTLEIIINIANQELLLTDGERYLQRFAVATARNGIGQLQNSECTPLGLHRIAEKIGDDCVVNTVFVGRQPTGEVYSEQLAKQDPGRDWILTRILWLEGLQPGFNQGVWSEDETQICDTKQRYIYIHGCPDSHPMRQPSSHGCIKMRNTDVIALFDRVAVGTQVSINEH